MGTRDKIILDTNCIIYLLSGDANLVELLRGRHIAFASISEIEILSYPLIQPKEEEQILDFLDKCFLLELDARVRTVAIEMRRNYKLKLPDAIVAASAFVHNYELFTADKEFAKVEGISITIYQP